MILVNAMGDACPIPVIKTLNAIRTMTGGGVVQTLVDNEIAVQNLTRLAEGKGYGIEAEQLEEKKYQVTITVGEDAALPAEDEPVACMPEPAVKKTVVVISSDRMGEGSDELGKALMKAFVYALSQQEALPATILFYNGGASLTCVDSPALEDLKQMHAQGVEILTCGTCLNFYGLTEQLQVGGVTNMYSIVEKMATADRIIKP